MSMEPETQSQPPADPPPAEAVVETPPPKRRRRGRWLFAPLFFFIGIRFKVLFFRLISYGIMLVAFVGIAIYVGATFFVKPDDLKKLVKDAVEEQTGGRIDIGSLQFNVLTGITLGQVQFYPPKAGDLRGLKYGGEIDPIPLANFEALSVRYSIPKLLAGRVHIKALQLVEPQFHLRQIDGVFNFDSILAYRAIKFPPGPEEKVEEKKPEDVAEGGALIPLDPNFIYMPLEVMAQNVGIQGLRLDLIKEQKGKIAQIVMTNGLSLDLGVYLFGKQSSVWVSLMSPFDRPLEVDIQEAKVDESGEVVGELLPTLAVKTALATRISVDDLKRLGFDFGVRIMSLKTPFAGYEDLGAFAKVRIALENDLRGVSVDTVDVSVADALDYDLTGKIGIVDASFKAFQVKLKQKLSIDLKNATTLAKPFVPGLVATGGITLDEVKVEGLIEPEKLADAANGAPLPYTTAILWLEDVLVDYPGTGVTMEPISGSLSLQAGPALAGTGSQIDVSLDLAVPKLDLTQQAKVGEVRAGVQELSAKITARALWPDMILPILKVNVEAEHVTTSGKGIAKIDAPLFVDVDADGRKDLSRMSLAANVELTDLAEISAMADCQQKCAKFRSNALVRIDSLQNLHAIAAPLAGVLNLGDFMPTKLTGALDFQFAARGKIPDPTSTPVPQLVKDAEVKFNTQLNLSKFNAALPFMKIDLKDFETRVLSSGSTASQKIEVAHKFESLDLTLPAAKGATKGTPLHVERFSFETGLQNDFDGPLDLTPDESTGGKLPKLVKNMRSEIFNKLSIGKVSAEGMLPQPLSDLRVTSLLKQVKLSDITLDELRVKIPDFGIESAVYVDVKMASDFLKKAVTGEKFTPEGWMQNAATRVTATVQHSGEEKLPKGIRTSGKIAVKLAVATDDMKTLAVDGGASFERFNLRMPNEDGKTNKILVEEINGELPFKQFVPIADLMPKPKAAAKAAVAADAPKEEVVAETKIAEVQIKDEDAVADEEDPALQKQMQKYFDKSDPGLPKGANIVAIVDYGTVRPFFPERRPLSIKKVEVANLELSQMEFDLELRQNWFALNQFVINFIGGKIQGDFQASFDPIPRTVRTSMHLTRLDTRKLIERFPNLKGKASTWSLFGSNPYLDGTVHLNYDIRNNDLQGGLEITSIGKEQLKMILFYIDPYEKDETMASIRSGLNFGEPRQVSVPIKNGFIDFIVDVRVLGAPLPLPKLQRFPISQVIQNLKDTSGSSGGDQQQAATTEGK